MGLNTIDSGLNSPRPPIANTVANSPDCSLHRVGGDTAVKAVTLTGGAGAKIYDCFTITGNIELLDLYGIFTRVTVVTDISVVSWQLWDSLTNVLPLTKVTGVDCSGAALNATILKTHLNDVAAEFLNSNQVRLHEVTGNKQFQGIFITAYNAGTTKIQLLATQDAGADCEITCYCDWVCRTPGSLVVPA